jgi:hypothetical protein
MMQYLCQTQKRIYNVNLIAFLDIVKNGNWKLILTKQKSWFFFKGYIVKELSCFSIMVKNKRLVNIFSSPELKAQVSYSDHLLSVVRLSVRLSVCLSVRLLSVNFYIFDFFSRTTGQILTKLGTNHPWGEGIQV